MPDTHDDCQHIERKYRTNGDMLRAKSNRELAQYLETMERRALFTNGFTRTDKWLKWLESEEST